MRYLTQLLIDWLGGWAATLPLLAFIATAFVIDYTARWLWNQWWFVAAGALLFFYLLWTMSYFVTGQQQK